MKKLIIIITIILLFAAAGRVSAQTVRVAAAANLRYVLDSIKTVYISHNPEVKIEVTYGASGTLVQQILNGAQFHLFMSADKTYPAKLDTAGTTTGDVRTYAFGKLVLWSNVVDVSKGIACLTDNAIKRIAIAKPDIAPYGDRALQCLKFYNLYDSVKNKIVFADNISQAAQYASSGNAEVGFLAYSLTFSPELSASGKYYLLDPKSYAPIDQACVLIKTWERNPAASDFMEYLFTPESKALFEAFGYTAPK